MMDATTDTSPEVNQAEWEAMAARSMTVCPNCGTELGQGICHFYYTTWWCSGCGANLDGRVVSPKVVLRCLDQHPDYDRHLGDPVHPLVCTCTGRGWFEIE
jgi:ribosomal protein L37AE/L43A